jgi:hypothetical protein
MKIPEIAIINVADRTEIVRKMSDEEYASHLEAAKVAESENAAQIKEQADKATAKAALLERLGITADEAALLLS